MNSFFAIWMPLMLYLLSFEEYIMYVNGIKIKKESKMDSFVNWLGLEPRTLPIKIGMLYP